MSLREPIEMRRRKLGAVQRAEPPTRRHGSADGVLTMGSYWPIWPKSRRDRKSTWALALRIHCTGISTSVGRSRHSPIWRRH